MKPAPNDGAVVEGQPLTEGVMIGHFSGPRRDVEASIPEVTVRFVQPSPPYVVGQLLELPEKTAQRLIRAGIAEKDKPA